MYSFVIRKGKQQYEHLLFLLQLVKEMLLVTLDSVEDRLLAAFSLDMGVSWSLFG